jgi:hypothetical protein
MANDIKSLYYITHIDNIQSIVRRGILSHSLVESLEQSEGLKFTKVYNEGIVNNRRNRNTPDDKSLWEYANLYF